MAKGEGFEPSIRDKPYTRLAGERLQPLGHPFIRLLFSSRFELLASPVARNERAFTLPFAFVQVLFFKSCIFFASLTANATFPPLSAISLGLFSGIWGRPISLSLNTGFCRPISLSLNTGFCRPISLSLNTGSFRAYFAIAQYGLFSRLFRYRSIRRFGSGYVLGLAPCAHTPTQLRYCRRQ